jgi:hypothetical protein
VLLLGDIESHENFAILSHGPPSVREARLGPPEQPSFLPARKGGPPAQPANMTSRPPSNFIDWLDEATVSSRGRLEPTVFLRTR